MDPDLEADLALLVSGLGHLEENKEGGPKVFKRSKDTLGKLFPSLSPTLSQIPEPQGRSFILATPTPSHPHDLLYTASPLMLGLSWSLLS